MVIRKPYAFLIKRFRLIHIFLFILNALLVFPIYGLYSFYSNYYASNNMSSIYGAFEANFRYWPYLVYILLMIVLGTILGMFISKKKPYAYYIILIGIYSLAMGILTYAYISLENLALLDTIDPTSIKMLMDLLSLDIAMMFISGILLALRVAGFRVKRFDFQKDLDEMEVSEADREEIEVGFEIDKDDIKTKINRFRRQLRYYYLENKAIFTGFAIFSLFSIIAAFVLYYIYGNRTFYENQKYGTYNLKGTVLGSYQLMNKMDEEPINSGKFYFIVPILFENKNRVPLKVTKDVYLASENWHNVYKTRNKALQYIPSRSYGEDVIPAKTKRIVSYVFELDKNLWTRGKILKIAYKDALNTEKGKYRTVVLAPTEVDNNKNKFVNLGKVIHPGKGMAFDTKYKIEEFNIYRVGVALTINKGKYNEYVKNITPYMDGNSTVISFKIKDYKDQRVNYPDDYVVIDKNADVVRASKAGPGYKKLENLKLDFQQSLNGEHYYILNTTISEDDILILRIRFGDTAYNHVLLDGKKKTYEKALKN